MADGHASTVDLPVSVTALMPIDSLDSIDPVHDVRTCQQQRLLKNTWAFRIDLNPLMIIWSLSHGHTSVAVFLEAPTSDTSPAAW